MRPIAYKILPALGILVLALALAAPAFGDTVVFERAYMYRAGEADSKLTCRAIALEQVKRLLLEELGTYLVSKTEVTDFQLTRDQITTLTAGIVRTEIVGEEWDGKTYTLKARIEADPKDVVGKVNALRNDTNKVLDLEDARNRAAEALKEIERLREEIARIKGKVEKEKLEEYDKNVKTLSASDWFEKGVSFGKSQKHKEAIEALDRAIEMDPGYAKAYGVRGVVYYLLKDYRSAIQNYSRAIELDQEYGAAYFLRGLAYEKTKEYQRAIADFDRAIELKPEYETYFNRGLTYGSLGKYQRAIQDFDKAIELNRKYAKAYLARGASNYDLGKYIQGCQDLKKACELGECDGYSLAREEGQCQ